MSRKRAVRNITEAGMSHAQDVHDRTVRYLVSMSIRMACFVLAVLTPSPWRWVFALGAIVLPWVAVLIANAGKEHGPPEQTSVIEHAPFAALGPGAGAAPSDTAPAGATGPAAGDASGSPSDAAHASAGPTHAAGAPHAAGASRTTGTSGAAPDASDEPDAGGGDAVVEPDLGSAGRAAAEDNGPDGEGPEIIIGELDADGERKND